MLLVSSAAAEESPAPASANADTGRMESIILSASIMLTMRFFMISSPLSVDLSGYTPKRNSRNGQKCQVEYSTKIQGNKALLRAAPAKKWCKIMGKITIRGGVCFSPIKKQLRNARRRFGTATQNILSALYAQSATTTTAASGGNREELLGQRPARRECRPRHDADAGCRNPIAAGIQKRFTCPPAAPPARLSGRADGSPLRQRSRPRAARTGRWRSPRPGGRADSAAPARWALRFPADGR